jgi:hypothetical protein
MIKEILNKQYEINDLIKTQLNEFKLFNLCFLLEKMPIKNGDEFKEFKEFWFDSFSSKFDLSNKDKVYLWVLSLFIKSSNKMPNIYDLKIIDNYTKRALRKSKF